MATGADPDVLAARAAKLLADNDLGCMTRASSLLYPHMWSWDAAFIAIGLASQSVPRAVMELDTLFSAQWANGMIPHIVFADGVEGYFPGPDRWACRELAAAAPTGRHTSGITQPPFMRSQYSASSTALGRVVDPTGSWLSSSSTAAGRTWCAGTGGWLRPATQLNAVGSPSTTGGSPGWTTRRGGTAPTRT